MTDPIVITKENDGDEIHFFQESSDESDVQVSRHRKNFRRKKLHHHNEPPQKSYASPPSAQAQAQVPKPNLPRTTLNDNMFEVFTNPDKKRLPESGSESAEDDHQPMDYGFPEEPREDDEEEEEYYEQPSNGFQSIEDEKQDLLYKFYRLTSKGVPVGKKFNMHSDIREMRTEFNRIQRDSEVKASIRFSRRMLMACVTGIEFLNKRYDPFDVKLDGWSESVMENMDDYDNVFERLHDKYASKVSMAPEIELLLSLAGSAFMFHLTNSMFSALPNIKDIAKQNPDILKNMMQSMASAQQQQSQPQQPPPSQNPPPTATGDGPREMKPPAFDMSSLFGMLNPVSSQMIPVSNATFPVGNATFPVPSRTNDVTPAPPPILKTSQPVISETNSVISSLSSESNTTSHFKMPTTVSLSGPKIVSIDTSQSLRKGGRGRKNKITSTKENTISI